MKRKSAEVARKSMSKRTEIVDATPIDTRSSEIEEVGPVCEAVDARADATF